MGAFEFGQPLPGYGPRAQTPDLSASTKQVSLAVAEFGQVVSYTITLNNAGPPLTGTVTITDLIPSGLAYLPGTLTATLGTPDDGAAPALTWSGIPGSAPLVSLTYAATVTTATAQSIINSALIDTGSAGQITRTATLIVNAQSLYLPLVIKE